MNHRIHVHCRTRNEIRILPYFFKHYDQFVERYFIRDCGSTDGTRELCKSNPKVTLFELPDSLVEENTLSAEKNFLWKEFSTPENCDWVIPCDPDEFLYHPNFLELLTQYKNEGIIFPQVQGYQMYSDNVPTGTGQIYDEIKKGVEAENYSKYLIMHPSVYPNYSSGCHTANPTGLHVKLSEKRELKLLHYKIFGKIFVDEALLKSNTRLSDFNRVNGLGVYSLDPNHRWNPLREYESVKANCKDVI